VADIESEVSKLVAKGKLTEEQSGAEIAKRIAQKQLDMEGMRHNVGTRIASAPLKATTPFSTPDFQLRNSEEILSREVGGKLAETTVQLEKNTHDVATGESVERSIKNHQAKLYAGLNAMDENYVKYATGHSKSLTNRVVFAAAKGAAAKAAGKAERKLTYKEFRTAMGDAMIAGDTHAIPEVEKAAKAFRKEIYDPLKDLAIKHLDADLEDAVKTDPSYLNRMFDMERLKADKGGFVTATSEWLMGRQKDNLARSAKFEKELPQAQQSIRAHRSEIDAIEQATYANTVKPIMDEANKALDEMLETLGDKIVPSSVGKSTSDMTKQAKGAAGKAFIKTLKKELGEDIEQEVRTASRQASREVSDDIVAKSDDVLDEGVLPLIREDLPPPPAKAGGAAAADTVSTSLKRIRDEAMVKAQKAYNNSLKAQAKRLKELADDPKKATAEEVAKIRRALAKEAASEAKKVAREVTKAMRKELRETVRKLSDRQKLNRRDIAERTMDENDYRELASEIYHRHQR